MNNQQPLRTKCSLLVGILSFAGVSTLLAVVDQTSKLWIRTNLTLGQSTPDSCFARLVYGQNDGAIFGLFPDNNSAFTAVAIVIIVCMLGAFTFSAFRYPNLFRYPYAIFFGMLFGGAVGNLIDRVRLGYVTDFISVGFWPSFNLADCGIVCGAILLSYFLFFPRRNNLSNARSI
jgi:signal peptidase II